MRVRITETVLRDANQSLIATRMSFHDFEAILEKLDQAGYHSIECWGGATFDSCLRYLHEDPWERLRKIKAKIKRTKLQMLLRGQNLIAYKHYPDDVVRKFVDHAIRGGKGIVKGSAMAINIKPKLWEPKVLNKSLTVKSAPLVFITLRIN
jgi:oxaloacetate decarboxylase alpha subunit